MTDKPKTYIWQALLEKSFNILIPVFAILAAFLISGILIIAWGANPLEAYKALLAGAFGTPNAIATTMTRLSPLVFTGLAVSYGYRSGFFNIGAEGQFFLGALAATWVGITFTNLPGWVLIPLCALAAALAGALNGNQALPAPLVEQVNQANRVDFAVLATQLASVAFSNVCL